jgi:integrase
MPRPRNLVPAYLFHKPTGQARVRIAGRDFYLGPFGSDDSRRKYGELVAKFAGGRLVDPVAISPDPADPGPAVAVLWLAYLDFAERHYTKNGKPTAELDCLKSAMKPVVELYGLLPIRDFGPMQLKAARNAMVAKGWTRNYVNKSVCRVRRVVRWGIENDMVEPVTLQRLEAVAGLSAGKTEAKDRPKREAVPMANVEAVKAFVSPLVRDLMDLQLLTGCRPGELLMLTTGMIDRTGGVWVAALADHKTVGHGKTRRLYFGPKAQLVLAKYLKADPAAKLFKITRSHYGNRVTTACETLGIPRFSPHWLRHNVTTTVRDQFGIESAQALAGHSKPDMTARYSTKMDKLAYDVVAKIG